ncbi:hypothetical protein NC653_015468 [Populus alba x Populus x berolinensis]|uniref:Uncharacterized protein n=1 Tax=Populus alba x Populus x berolinensis TaxID=444605 RepID=A0AAD6VYH2_9ROSI|nr:hypothetical protein NC653_015468 [Populus alba x Populus x berolinensis]
MNSQPNYMRVDNHWFASARVCWCFKPGRIGRVDLSGAGASAWKEQRDSPTEHDFYPSML